MYYFLLDNMLYIEKNDVGLVWLNSLKKNMKIHEHNKYILMLNIHPRMQFKFIF